MRRMLLLSTFALLVALLPSAALAQQNDDDDGDFALRINGDYTVPEGQSVGTLFVINGDAIVQGTVRDFLLVINGTADIAGTVRELVVVNGDAILRSGATVEEDVLLIRSDIDQQPGSTVGGDIEQRSRLFFRGAWILLGILFWLAMTATLLVAGLVFAAVGRRQLAASTSNLSDSPGQSVLGAVIVLFGAPLAVFLAFITVIGIPLGIGLMLFLIPALLFLGFLVAAAWVGGLILSGFKRDRTGANQYLAVVVGVLVLQVIALIPAFGWLVWILAALYGLGGLVYLAWRAARGRSTRPDEPAAPPPPAPSPA
jgi:nitrate reductase NapE component